MGLSSHKHGTWWEEAKVKTQKTKAKSFSFSLFLRYLVEFVEKLGLRKEWFSRVTKEIGERCPQSIDGLDSEGQS